MTNSEGPGSSFSQEALEVLTVHRLFEVDRVEADDSKIILCDDSVPNGTFTRSQVAVLAKSVAAQLDALLQSRLKRSLHKSSIAVYMPNGAEYVPTFIGIACGGGVNCLLNPKYLEPEISFAVTDLSCSAIIVAHGAKNDEAILTSKKLEVPIIQIRWAEAGAGAATPSLILSWLDDDHPTTTPPSAYEFPKNIRGSDIALKLHTSGTTSKPKTVPLSHSNIVVTCLNQANTFQWKSRSDRSLLLMPLFHVHGLFNGCLGPLSHKCYVAIPKSKAFSKSQVWKDLEHHKINHITAVPSILQIMFLDVTEPVTSVQFRYIRACSSALAPALAEKISRLTNNAPILESYAMTEATHQMCSNLVGHAKLGSIGFPCGIELAIIDGNTGELCAFDQPGEICVRGFNVIDHYENLAEELNHANFRYNLRADNSKGDKAYVSSIPDVNAIVQRMEDEKDDQAKFQIFKSSYVFDDLPNKFCRDLQRSPRQDKGFLRTGDLGSMAQDGRVTYIGRLKELINRGGEKISPIEIDGAYLRLKGVKYASAFGIHDDILGEKVAIAIVPEEYDPSKFEAMTKELVAEAKQYLSAFKIPVKTYFCEALPLGPSGKVLRRNLLEHVQANKCPFY